MTRSVLALALAAALVAPLSAQVRGYTATTGTDPILTPSSGSGPAVGDVFATPANQPGTFTAYVPNTPQDPQIAAGDIVNFRYRFTGQTLAIVNNTIQYGGNYQIFYAPTGNSVSSGLFSLTATFGGAGLGPNDARLTGVLNQTAGPDNAAFADLSQGGQPVGYNGTYFGTNPGVSGLIQGTLSQPVPEPASVALLASAGAGLFAVVRRRRKVV